MNDLNFEKSYWGNCANTFHEEVKQLIYAKLMGLEFSESHTIDAQNKSIIDIGGGPVSLLLKTINLKTGTIIDPLVYPKWIYERYCAAGLNYSIVGGENFSLNHNYDECWIYNCLQHTQDPAKIISNVKKISSVLRIFEWIDIPAHDGHPHELKQEMLQEWIGQSGNAMTLSQQGCFGKCFYGVFNFL